MANKELEILIRAKDGATPILKSVAKSARDTEGGFKGVAETFKDLRQGGPNEALEQLIRFGTKAAIVEVAVKAIERMSEAVVAYRETVNKYGPNVAKDLAIEKFADSVPVVSQMLKGYQALTGTKSTADEIKGTEEIIQGRKELIGTLVSYQNLNRQIEAAQTSTSDLRRADLQNEIQSEQALLPLLLKRQDVEETLEELEKKAKKGQADWQDKLKLADAKKQLDLIDKLMNGTLHLSDLGKSENRRKDELRQADARAQGELRVTKITSDLRKQLFTDYGQQLQAELDALRSQTNEKVKLIELAAIKEKEGKGKAEQRDIDERSRRESEAAKKLADIQSGALYRADLFRKRDENSQKEQKGYDTATKLRAMFIDGLEREAQLGSENARIEAERLKITQETADKRRELLAILGDENSGFKDRAAATAGLFYLTGDEQRKKALAGIQGVAYGTTAAASTGFFTSGVEQRSREQIAFNPLLLEQREANKKLDQAVKALQDLPTTLKNLGIALLPGVLPG